MKTKLTLKFYNGISMTINMSKCREYCIKSLPANTAVNKTSDVTKYTPVGKDARAFLETLLTDKTALTILQDTQKLLNKIDKDLDIITMLSRVNPIELKIFAATKKEQSKCKARTKTYS